MSNNQATIKRAKKDRSNPYKAMRRATFEDIRLSFEARGVLGYLLVKPDDWEMRVSDLMHQGDMGRDKTYRIINELINAGYFERIEVRSKGKITHYDYVVYEEPLTENQEAVSSEPLPEKPLTVEPLTENQYPTNKEVNLLNNKTATKEEEKPTNQPVSRSLIGDERLVGLAEQQQQWVEDLTLVTDPPIEATAVAPPVPSGPPAALGSISPLVDFLVAEIDLMPDDVPPAWYRAHVAAQPPDPPPSPGDRPPWASKAAAQMVLAMLLDEDVMATARDPARHAAIVRGWVATHDPDYLLRHLAVWWVDYQTAVVEGFGALAFRVDHGCMPNEWPDAFTASELYARHYPVPRERLASWVSWQKEKHLADVVIGIDKPSWLDVWLAMVPDDVRQLLDMLPLPKAVSE